jgi:hypothetical protein
MTTSSFSPFGVLESTRDKFKRLVSLVYSQPDLRCPGPVKKGRNKIKLKYVFHVHINYGTVVEYDTLHLYGAHTLTFLTFFSFPCTLLMNGKLLIA